MGVKIAFDLKREQQHGDTYVPESLGGGLPPPATAAAEGLGTPPPGQKLTATAAAGGVNPPSQSLPPTAAAGGGTPPAAIRATAADKFGGTAAPGRQL